MGGRQRGLPVVDLVSMWRAGRDAFVCWTDGVSGSDWKRLKTRESDRLLLLLRRNTGLGVGSAAPMLREIGTGGATAMRRGGERAQVW